jgi:hypothetical protein
MGDYRTTSAEGISSGGMGSLTTSARPVDAGMRTVAGRSTTGGTVTMIIKVAIAGATGVPRHGGASPDAATMLQTDTAATSEHSAIDRAGFSAQGTRGGSPRS